MSYQIDLSAKYNNIIYRSSPTRSDLENLPQSLHGVRNIHIIDKKMDNLKCFGIDFKFIYSNKYDNISCDGEIILIPNNVFKSISFLGFSEMGTICDDVIIQTKTERIKIPLVLKTIHTDNIKGIDDVGPNSNCKEAFACLGDDGQKHYIYFWEYVFEEEHAIKNIKLPVNRALHIMAITLK